MHSSIGGMLRTLDPHSNFLAPESYSNMRDRQRSTFYGLGILVGMRNGQLTVITPILGTPASRMGIRAGDVISTIEDEPTDAMNIDDAVRRAVHAVAINTHRHTAPARFSPERA